MEACAKISHRSPTFCMPSSSLPSPTTQVLRWHEPALIKVTVACHVAAAVAVVAEPTLWPWAVAALAVNHVVLTTVGMLPRSGLLGSNLRALPAASRARREVAITVDDGPDPDVTPKVLDLLDAHGARATFFCIGEQAERHADLCREIVARGHSVQNHTQRHSHMFAFSGPAAFAREIDHAQQTLTRITGQRPMFFRAPAGFRNLFLAPVLHRLNLQLVSWTRRGYDTVRSNPDDVLKRLTRRLGAGDILVLHDSSAERTPSGRPAMLKVLPELLRRIDAAGLHSVTLPQAMLSSAESRT
jgi:peptidoglycan/xylan/chitin deacetylase (PgdA/CDA1 family)